ncbi:metallophosphoesterase family protein, partial [Nodularia sphaerocarpa]
MKLVSDPAIAKKISKMQERVKWQDPLILERGIDQTRLILADDDTNNRDFSFLVVGDSGTGSHRGHNPQRQVAKQMLPHHSECSFMLHTGDVIYLVGSSEYYQQNFIRPYREFLVGGEDPEKIDYDQMVFNLPILPVPGNHDYYDLPVILSLLSFTTLPIRRLLRSKLDLDVGLHGSGKGSAYAKAFLDYLKALELPGELAQHLDNYYTAQTDTGRCLNYQPGRFTRLPNRYYTFCYRGIDFFALDSNTFNEPAPIPQTRAGREQRRSLEKRRQEFEQEKLQIMEISAQLNPENPSDAEKLDDLQGQISQIEELIVDIEKQLNTDKNAVTDIEQLEWLKQRLIKSWESADIRGRVVYFHHPPYVTEATKWQQAQTLAVRDRLRGVLD